MQHEIFQSKIDLIILRESLELFAIRSRPQDKLKRPWPGKCEARQLLTDTAMELRNRIDFDSLIQIAHGDTSLADYDLDTLAKTIVWNGRRAMEHTLETNFKQEPTP